MHDLASKCEPQMGSSSAPIVTPPNFCFEYENQGLTEFGKGGQPSAPICTDMPSFSKLARMVGQLKESYNDHMKVTIGCRRPTRAI